MKKNDPMTPAVDHKVHAMPPAVEFLKVTKQFGAVMANKEVSFSVSPKTLHALVGENGAGKSTAMNILFGLYPKDSGEIRLNGEPYQTHSTRDAQKRGLGMVHQHFMLCPTVSALDNLLVGDERFLRWPWLPKMLRPFDRRRALAYFTNIAQQHGLEIPFQKKISELGVGEQQRVEILKLLYSQARILILDEPTAVLAPPEVEKLFASLKKLRDSGCTVIVVTHKLHDVLAHTDAVTVFRQGQVVAELFTKNTSEQELANFMVGESFAKKNHAQKIGAAQNTAGENIAALNAAPRTPVFEAKNISLKQGSKTFLKDISLQVLPGEIVGLAGIEGNGQSELIRLILNPKKYFHPSFAAPIKATGELCLFGQRVEGKTNRQITDLNIGFLPEDRLHQGFLPSMTMAENFILGQTARFSVWGFLRWKNIFKTLRHAIKTLDIRPPNPDLPGENLSGGNQQKLVVARELQKKSNFLLAAHPTRGVDIGAIERIHSALRKEQIRGVGVLLISSDLDELVRLSDRIFVILNGQLVGEFTGPEFNQQKIGWALCQGGHQNA